MSNSNYQDRKERILQTLKETDGFSSFYSQHFRLIPSGQGKAKAVCPFHDDKNPSLSINLENGNFHCFGCKVGGDIFAFRMKLENIHFNECLDAFEQSPIVPAQSVRPIETPVKSRTALPSMQNVLEWHQALLDEKNLEVHRFLNTKRGITDESTKQFKLGYDRTKGALIIPIFTPDGGGIDGAKMFRYDLSTGEKHVWTIGSAHLFGVHLLLRDYERHGIVIVCEGEFDSIILNQNSFLAVTGTAGAGTWKPEWNAFFKGKNVVLCYDSDVAGRAGALNLLNELQGTASSIKNIDLFGSEATKDMKDVTDFFVKAQKTAKDFRLMIDSANPSAMPTPNTPNSHPILEDNSVERLRQDIVNLSGETQSESRLNNLAEKSYELLTQLGAFIRDRNGEVFYYSRFRHRIFKLQTQLFEDLVSTETSANQASTGFRYILALASVRARETAQAALISRYTHYDKDKAILYLGNHPEYYLRITPTEITTVPNGTDQLYFSMDWRFDSFEYDPTVAAGGESFAHEVLVDSISFDDGDNSILNREEQATLYWHCILALHFLTASRTKPPLTFLGEPGSGKTTALRILGTALFGPRFEVMSPSSDERDIVAAITRQPFAVLDNVDTRSKFLEDLIARVATGISYTRRKLYSDNDEIEIIPRAQLGLTSMQPYFDREDVADRLIIFRLQRHECISFRDEGSIVSDVLAKRSVILSGIIHALQRALKNIEQNKERVKLTRFRMADAALLMTRMSDEPETMMSLIAKMQDEQTKFLAEGHPLTEIICQWVRDNPQCSGIFFTTADLFSELNTYAQSKRLVFFHRSVKSLGMAISNQMRALQTRLIVTKDPSKTGNVKRYSFTLIRN